MWLVLLLLPMLLVAKPCTDCQTGGYQMLQRKQVVQKLEHTKKGSKRCAAGVCDEGDDDDDDDDDGDDGDDDDDDDDGSEGSIVKQHGFLKVQGNKVVDESGATVRLRGMSLFWSQWKPQFWTKGTVRWLKRKWGITLLRCPMAVEADGYLTHPEEEMKKVKTVVEAAVKQGIYVIIDWHDHNAEQHQEAAAKFFEQIAKEFGHLPNVIFEIFNEPIFQWWNETIKPYHEKIVSVIRPHSSNLIVLGTGKWSQDVDIAAEDPVAGENLAYTIHFYANTHKQELRDKVIKALESVAIFATEWGTCDASGDGTLNLEETQTWLDFFEEHQISDANWAISDKQEACSALLPGASSDGGWEDCELTESGHFVRFPSAEGGPLQSKIQEVVTHESTLAAVKKSTLLGESMANPLPEPCPRLTTPPPGMCSDSTEDCSKTGCCNELGTTCFQKNEWWASCKVSCTPGIDPSDPPAWASPWTCKVLTRDGLEGDSQLLEEHRSTVKVSA